jgi:hypothetical protein
MLKGMHVQMCVGKARISSAYNIQINYREISMGKDVQVTVCKYAMDCYIMYSSSTAKRGCTSHDLNPATTDYLLLNEALVLLVRLVPVAILLLWLKLF